MGDLKANFDKILTIARKTWGDRLTESHNLREYPNSPGMSDLQIVTLSLLQEALSIDSESWFPGKLQTDYPEDFPAPGHLSNYNRRRKRLGTATEQLARLWGESLCPHEDTFMVDSVPVPVAHIAREHSTTICRKQFHTAPDKGYSASLGQYFIGYKLHVVLTVDGVYQSMDLSKASVHDSRYLKDIKHSGLQNCLLLADKGYISSQRQRDLFYSKGIQLQTPMRRNQRNFRPWPKIFKNARRRVETVFSQLCGQMMLKRNYAKTFIGLRTRLIAKIASVTLLQYINDQNGNPLNHIKHALAA